MSRGGELAHELEDGDNWDVVVVGDEEGREYIRYESRTIGSDPKMTVYENGELIFETSDPVLDFVYGPQSFSLPERLASTIIDRYKGDVEALEQELKVFSHWADEIEQSLRNGSEINIV